MLSVATSRRQEPVDHGAARAWVTRARSQLEFASPLGGYREARAVPGPGLLGSYRRAGRQLPQGATFRQFKTASLTTCVPVVPYERVSWRLAISPQAPSFST